MEPKQRFGKKFKKLKKFFEDTSNNFEYWVKKLENSDVDDFFELYKIHIESKKNGVVFDFVNSLKAKIALNRDILFGYIKDRNILIAGGVFMSKTEWEKQILVSAYRAANSTYAFKGISLGMLIEFLHFHTAACRGISVLSKGRDRNAYGWVGSNIGVPLHKLELYFKPMIASRGADETIFLPDAHNDISQDILYFSDPNEEGFYQKAIVVLYDKSNINPAYWIIEKRGLQLEIR